MNITNWPSLGSSYEPVFFSGTWSWPYSSSTDACPGQPTVSRYAIPPGKTLVVTDFGSDGTTHTRFRFSSGYSYLASGPATLRTPVEQTGGVVELGPKACVQYRGAWGEGFFSGYLK